MYLRTTRRTNRDGTEVSYYQLAHNHRDPDTGIARAQVIHNFGRTDLLDRDELVRLCRSIARVCGLEVHDLFADHEGVQGRDGSDVLPAGVHMVETRALGAVWVIEALWERFGIGRCLREIERKSRLRVPYERALLAMTANRLCVAQSKLGVWDRWLETVHLPSCSDLKLDQMYEAMDVLHEHIEEIEKTIFFKTADLLNLEVDLVFYDTTTCSFSIDQPDDIENGGLRCFGHSKEGTWSPQVVVALAVTRDGLPVRSWVFPGNTSDCTTVERVRKDLRGWKLGRALFVADSGMNSEHNRRELAKACGTYLLAVRAGSVAEVHKDVLSRAGRFKEIAPNLRAKEVTVGQGERRRRYIVCHNPEEAARESAHRQQVLADLKKELKAHKTRKATAKWAIELMASGRYGRYLKIGRGNTVVIDQEAVRKAQRLDGKWVLMTNDDTLAIEDGAAGYKSLLVIERCFRSLKRTQICMTPMHHWLPRRIEAHVKICVLALLLERIAELATGQPWSRIRPVLDKLQATEFRSDSHLFFRRNDIPAKVRDLLKELEVTAPKTVLNIQSAT